MSTQSTPMPQTLRTLLNGLIDYAGLFPPAKLDMAKTVESYARDGMGEFHWALGRLICPVSRLDELTEHGRMVMPGSYAFSGYVEHPDRAEPWMISCVLDRELDESLDLIDGFNERHSSADQGLAKIDAVEMRVASPSDVDVALDEIPEDIMPFFELPVLSAPGEEPVDLRGFVAALAGHEGAAKIRCGGVRAEMIPPVGRVAEFIHLCAQADVRFKATAGLHHPIRAEQPLTYEASPPMGVMHGFVNVFIASALARLRRAERDLIEQVLGETDPATFSFTNEAAGWREHTVDAAGMAKLREGFALGYGSCSFVEPIDDLRALGWL